MISRSRLLIIGYICLSSWLGAEALADLTIRECHLFTEGRSGQQRERDVLRLLPSSEFRTIATLTADFEEISDLVVQAAVWLAPGSSRDGLIELEVRAGDRIGARSSRRVPGDSPHTVLFRSLFPDQASGQVTFRIAGRNLSEGPVDLFGFWISPLVVPGSMGTRTLEQWDSMAIDDRWTELAAIEMSEGVTQALAVAEVSLLQGRPGTKVTYRVITDGDRAEQSAWVPGNFPESHEVAGFLSPGTEHSRWIRLEARASAPATVGQRRLMVQQIPGLPVLEGRSADPVEIRNDGLRYRLARSGQRLLEDDARGDCGRPGSECDGRHTHGWGWSSLLLEGSGLTESMSVLRLVDSSEQALWCPPGCGSPPCEPRCRPGDIGIATVATSGDGRIGGGPSAWLHVGLSKDDPVEAVLEIHGSCPRADRGISVAEAQFEILVLPDNEIPGHDQECFWNADLLVRNVRGAQRQCFEAVHGVGEH